MKRSEKYGGVSPEALARSRFFGTLLPEFKACRNPLLFLHIILACLMPSLLDSIFYYIFVFLYFLLLFLDLLLSGRKQGTVLRRYYNECAQ